MPMFEIIVYSFRKKINSTKRVTESDALKNTKMQCRIITNGCGIIAPNILINYGLAEAPVNFNYCYIPVFKRYYFIQDWKTDENSLWRATLQEDFLATWRSAIVSYNAYIVRASSKMNVNIEDTLSRTRADISIVNSDIPNPYNINSDGFADPVGGYYVVGIVGAMDLAGYSEGGVAYYVFDALHMQLLGNRLMQDTSYMKIDWTTGDTKKFITEDLLMAMYNPMQYISSCMWYQSFAADKGTEQTSIKFGYWTIENIQCRLLKLDEAQETVVRNIPVPKHPQLSEGAWLGLSPYTVYQAHIAPYGIIDVPADELVGSDNLAVEVVEDYITGNARVMLAAAGRRFFNIVNFQMGVTVQVSQITQNPFGAVASGLANTVGALGASAGRTTQAMGAPKFMSDFAGDLGGTIAEIATGIGDVITAVSSTLQTTGSNGCKAWYRTGESFWRLSAKFTKIESRNGRYTGYPVCGYHNINSFNNGDFIKCEAASLNIEGNAVEQQIVNEYLNSGFYYE